MPHIDALYACAELAGLTNAQKNWRSGRMASPLMGNPDPSDGCVLLAGSSNAAQIKRSHKNQFSIQLPVIARVVLFFPPSLYKVSNDHAQNANNDEPKRNRFYPQGVIPQENSDHHCGKYRGD
ncbi:MAG: hypothetical protein O6950_05105 [Gammaproteobacteria bacterium]|nr:hypothetical protein [Gammaproteobacteria bacterium]